MPNFRSGCLNISTTDILGLLVLCCEADMCVVRHLMVSLPTHQMLVSAVVTTKKVSRHCKKCLDTGGGRKGMDAHHWLRNNALDWKLIAITAVLSPHEGSFLLESKPHEFLLQLYSLSLKSKMIEYFQPENQLVCHNFKFYTYIFEWQVY